MQWPRLLIFRGLCVALAVFRKGQQEVFRVSMHPSLALNLHSKKCQEVIRELEKCHRDHPLRKFFGACNPLKRALNECLKREVAERRKENYAIAQKRKRKYQELMNDK